MTNQKSISKHEAQYWHIPKFSILPLLGFILFTFLAIANFHLIDSNVIKEVFKSCEDTCVYNLKSSDLINIYPIIGEYLLISLGIISLIASIKKGYKNLNPYDEVGLIVGLIGGLIVGLISGLIVGLIVGLIGGLISGLISGLIVGLSKEFK
jgi:hypothetical protein